MPVEQCTEMTDKTTVDQCTQMRDKNGSSQSEEKQYHRAQLSRFKHDIQQENKVEAVTSILTVIMTDYVYVLETLFQIFVA